MSHASPQELFERLRGDVAEGRCQQDDTDHWVDVDRYVSQPHFDAERRLAFRRYPIVLGHEAMLPEANTCMRHDALGVPLLVSRDADGDVHAFYNVCRHRQTKLFHDDGVCAKPRLSCPYHGWTYTLDGRLIGVPMPEGFPSVDKSQFGLKELPVTIEHGFLFTTLDGQPDQNARPHLAELDAHLTELKLAEHTYFTHRYTEVASNWKVVYDAFSEAYHIQHLHRTTLAEFFLDNVTNMQPMGLHLCSAVGRQGLTDPDANCGDIESLRNLVTFTYHIFPNSLLIVSPDYVNMLTLYPQSPHSTLVLDTMLTRYLPEDDKARDHWHRSFDLLDTDVFGREDYWISEQIQAGFQSGATDRFLIGRYECGIRIIHDILDNEMERQRKLIEH